jgi:hypothetical protein
MEGNVDVEPRCPESEQNKDANRHHCGLRAHLDNQKHATKGNRTDISLLLNVVTQHCTVPWLVEPKAVRLFTSCSRGLQGVHISALCWQTQIKTHLRRTTNTVATVNGLAIDVVR